MAKPVQVISSIVPQGGTLVNVRNGNPALGSLYLEVFEVVFGVLILAFILGKQYKALTKRKMVLPATEQKYKRSESMAMASFNESH